jgi:hypothetical protein
MTNPIEPSTLRILLPDGRTVGTGFLVANGLLATSAHVIIDADAYSGDLVQVQFTGGVEKLNALVVPEYWLDIDRGDVAILKLESVPEGIIPLRLAPAAGCRPGNLFHSFGYATAADVQGIIARGTIDGYLEQHKLLQLQAPQASHGISGAPVLDEKRGVIVGMITKGHTELGRNEETIFATPSEVIWQACPQIPVQHLKEKSEEFLQVDASKDIRDNLHAGLTKEYLAHFIRFIEEAQKPWGIKRWVPLTAIKSREDIPIRHVKIYLQPYEGEEKERIQAISSVGKPVDLFEVLSRRNPVVILGEPGSGKSFAVRRWLWEFSKALLEGKKSSNNKDLLLPIYVDISEYRETNINGQPEELLTFLKNYLYQFGFAQQIIPHLKNFLMAGRLVVVFDGLNEMPSNDFYQRLKLIKDFVSRQYPANRYIFTCRTLHYDEMLNYDTFILTDLVDERIKQFLEIYLDDTSLANKAYQDLGKNPNLAHHCSRPFVLQMYAAVYNRLKRIPNSRAQLFQYFIQLQLNQETLLDGSSAEPHLQKITIQVVSILAFEMLKQGLIGTSVSMVWISQNTALREQLSLIQAAGDAGILDISKRKKKFAFSHQILQEYFAALQLKQIVHKGGDVEQILSNPNWEEVSLLVAGLFSDPSTFIGILVNTDPVQPYRVFLSGQIVHEYQLLDTTIGGLVIDWIASIADPDKIPDSVYHRKDAQRIFLAVDAIQILALFENHPKAVESLCNVLATHNHWVIEVTVHLLANASPESLWHKRFLDYLHKLPWGDRSPLVNEKDVEDWEPYRVRNQIQPLLIKHFKTWSVPIRKEVLTHVTFRWMTDLRIWSALTFATFFINIFFVAAKWFKSGILSIYSQNSTFDQELVIALANSLYLLCIGFVFIFLVGARDEWNKFRILFNLQTWKKVISDWRRIFELIILIVTASLSFWFLNNTTIVSKQIDEFFDNPVIETVIQLVCLPSAYLLLIGFILLCISSIVWFYSQWKNGNLNKALFENRIISKSRLGRSPRASLGGVVFISIFMTPYACMFSLLLGGRIFDSSLLLTFTKVC